MIRIDASTIPAGVMQIVTNRDEPYRELVGKSMGQIACHMDDWLEDTIAALVFGACPVPTPCFGIGLNSVPEAVKGMKPTCLAAIAAATMSQIPATFERRLAAPVTGTVGFARLGMHSRLLSRCQGGASEMVPATLTFVKVGEIS